MIMAARVKCVMRISNIMPISHTAVTLRKSTKRRNSRYIREIEGSLEF
jgi:hypothetical protein